MKKVIGYAISIAGIATMIIGFGMVNVPWPIVKTLGARVLVIAGVATISVGVIIALKFGDSSSKKISRVKHSGEKEVPIYEGTGKNRKVVGYRND